MYPVIYPKDPKTGMILNPGSNGANNTCRSVLNSSAERKASILNDTPAFFSVSDNFSARGAEPFIEWKSRNQSHSYTKEISIAANRHQVDPELIRSIMFMETTHGYYDVVNPFRRTVLPMNIHYEYWNDIAISEAEMEKPSKNIDVGAFLLNRIQKRVTDPSVAKIASVYNVLGREFVNDYGARVATIYKEAPWKIK